MKPRPYIGSAILLALIAGAIGCQSLQRDGGAGSGERSGESGIARVERVVDGDTVILSSDLGSSRIVGVDTPETVKPDTPVQCFGPRASAFTKHVLGAAGKVRYKVAREPVDSYGRSLVYLWLPDGRFFNAMLVRGGYARTLPFPPNTRYAPLFQRLAQQAARRGRAGSGVAASHCPVTLRLAGAMRSRGSLSRKQLLILLGIATVVFDLVLVFLDQKMMSAGGPSILGFEFAGSEQQASKVMAEWGATGRDYARWSLWLDYGFMLSYGGFFALAAVATRDFARHSGLRRLAAVGVVAPFAAIAAASFDATENVFLLLTLGGHGGSFGPPIATVCATLKFALIAFAIAYVLWGLAARLLRARRADQDSGA